MKNGDLRFKLFLVFSSKCKLFSGRDNECIAVHRRDRNEFGYTTEKEHMPSSQRFLSQWSPEFFISWASGIGEPTKHFIEKVLESKAHPEQGYKSCLGVLSFAKKQVKKDSTMLLAEHYVMKITEYSPVKKTLDKGLEKEPVQLEIPCFIPAHENIRGENHYQ